MQLLISDANILIDMEEGQLIEQMFQLPYQFSTPDIIYFEELEDDHGRLPGLGLNICELESETMTYAADLMPRYKRTSRNDCLALALASQERCPLLTGDKALRQAASDEGVIVIGTLWIVEQLIRQGLISIAEARGAYKKMESSGRRLPWSRAETALKELEVSLGS